MAKSRIWPAHALATLAAALLVVGPETFKAFSGDLDPRIPLGTAWMVLQPHTNVVFLRFHGGATFEFDYTPIYLGSVCWLFYWGVWMGWRDVAARRVAAAAGRGRARRTGWDTVAYTLFALTCAVLIALILFLLTYHK